MNHKYLTMTLCLLALWCNPLNAQQRATIAIAATVATDQLDELVDSKLAPEFHALLDYEGTFVGFQKTDTDSTGVIEARRRNPVAANANQFYQVVPVASRVGEDEAAIDLNAQRMIITFEQGQRPTTKELAAAGLRVSKRNGKPAVTTYGRHGGSMVVEPTRGEIDSRLIARVARLDISYIQPQYPVARIPEPQPGNRIARANRGNRGVRAARGNQETLPEIPERDVIQPNVRARSIDDVAPGESDPTIAGTDASEVRPTDQFYDKLWGMEDLNAPTAWASRTDAKPITVAVFDTGVDYRHIDLAPNMWKNAGENPGNRRDDDNNGYVDDVYGYDFIGGDSNPMDDNDHGSHCAGTIGALGNGPARSGSGQNRGVAGVCWKVNLMAIRILGAQRNPQFSSGETVRYAVDNGAKVLSNSWTSFTHYNDDLKRAIDYAKDKNVLYVAAAANDQTDNDRRPYYPSSYPNDNVIAVGALTQTQQVASFSNWGKTSVDLFAPGTGIWSTVPGNRLDSMSGTSMACPHVAGACALVWAEMGADASYQDVKSWIMDNTRSVSSLRNKCVTEGTLDLSEFSSIDPGTGPGPGPGPGPNPDTIAEIRQQLLDLIEQIEAINRRLDELGGN